MSISLTRNFAEMKSQFRLERDSQASQAHHSDLLGHSFHEFQISAGDSPADDLGNISDNKKRLLTLLI
jgi:hypothetical protein